jgi:chromosome segregation protein
MVDAALGEGAQAVVVETWRDAGSLFSRPDAKRALSLLVLEGMRGRLTLPEDSLASRVRCEDALRPLVDTLLGQVRIRPTLGLDGAAPKEALATRGGHYLTPSGTARMAPGGGGSPVSLRAEVAAVSAARGAALEALRQADTGARAAGTASASRSQGLAAARAGLEKARASESEAQRLWGESDLRANMARERLAEIGTEQEALRISKRSAEMDAEILGAVPSAGEAPAAIEAASPDAWAVALDQARQVDAAVRLEQARGEGELARTEAGLRETGGAVARTRDEETEALQQAQSDRQGASRLLAEAAERERIRKEVEAAGSRGREAMAALEGEAREAGQRLRTAAQTLREMGDVLRSLEENHQGFVLRRREVEAKRDSLLQQCRENFGWAETEVAQAPEESLPAAELEEGLAVLLKEAESLDEQIRRMGSVNLEALEEEEQLAQRVKGLVASRDDLSHAGVSLAELIKELDACSEAQFIQVFEEVKANFQELFRRLFGGGRADVILEDPAHVLESGIEIIARPPGREPMPISLLSGGQKAMVAVALIFAFFRSRPSPFYILDEVDAPLDESNIDRFLGLLQEFARDSQFLIITHNRRTMRAANTLYGVTMQRPGISTRLSVRFEELHASGLLQPKQPKQS